MNTQPFFNPEAEASVLGAVLYDSKAIDRVRTMLDVDDFADHKNKTIYAAILSVEVPDIITVSAKLRDEKKLESVGGVARISELVDNVPSAANVEHYAKIVKEKATLRKIVTEAQGIIEQTKKPDARPESIPTRLSIEVQQDISVNASATVTERLNANIARGYHGLPTGYNCLEKSVRKVMPGHLWVIGAYTSVGKSAFLVDFVCRQYRYGNPGIAIFSTEMSEEQYLVRCLSNETGLPTWAITDNTLTDAQRKQVEATKKYFASKNFYLYDKLYRIEDIERTARLLKKRGLNILAIDYIQNLWGDGKIYERMSKLAPLLQYLAKDLEITIIALSQVSNEHVRNRSEVHGFKGAGEIAAAADVCIELTRDKNNQERLLLNVGKNRHGRLGKGELDYINGFTSLNEVMRLENCG